MILARVDTSGLQQAPVQQNNDEPREGFICPVCQSDFVSDVALKEHFVTEHLYDNHQGGNVPDDVVGRSTPTEPRLPPDRRQAPQSEPKSRSIQRSKQQYRTPQPARHHQHHQRWHQHQHQRFCTTCGESLVGMIPAAVQKHYQSHNDSQQTPIGMPAANVPKFFQKLFFVSTCITRTYFFHFPFLTPFVCALNQTACVVGLKPPPQSPSVQTKGSRFSPRMMLKSFRKSQKTQAPRTPLTKSEAAQPNFQLTMPAEGEAGKVKRTSLLKKISSPISTMLSGSRNSLPDTVGDASLARETPSPVGSLALQTPKPLPWYARARGGSGGGRGSGWGEVCVWLSKVQLSKKKISHADHCFRGTPPPPYRCLCHRLAP